jgi:hypothetical protein
MEKRRANWKNRFNLVRFMVSLINCLLDIHFVDNFKFLRRYI